MKNNSVYSEILLDFQREHSTIELVANQSRILLIPELQGKVMAVSDEGASGAAVFPGSLYCSKLELLPAEESCGLTINDQRFDKAMIPVTAEETSVPSLLTDPWNVIEVSPETATFQQIADFSLNDSLLLPVELIRRVTIIDPEEIADIFPVSPSPTTKTVVYESLNQLKNNGTEPWTTQQGFPVLKLETVRPVSGEALLILELTSSSIETLEKNKVSFYTRGKYTLIALDHLAGRSLQFPASQAPAMLGIFEPVQSELFLLFYSLDRTMSATAMAVAHIVDHPALKIAVDEQVSSCHLETYAPPVALDAGEIRFHSQRIFHFRDSATELSYLLSTFMKVGL